MIFTETSLPGSYLIQMEPIWDERGFFARIWCEEEFRDHGLNPSLRQTSLSFNLKKGTLRGMHYQIGKFQEAKLIRCVTGAIFDVIIDLRRESSTFRKYFGVVLASVNRKLLYVPEGFAHGYQALTNNTEVFYQISKIYSPEHARGVRWNDPVFAIDWPEAVTVISARDRDFPDFDPERHGL
jgi:dTDP-4-dehydrorhamnose 3,5-epimerase